MTGKSGIRAAGQRGVLHQGEEASELAVKQFEMELKLELNSGDAEKLRAFLPEAFKPGAAQTLDSVYFDTPEQHLRQSGFSLRIRRIGERRIQTLKADGDTTAGLFARPEWERDIESDVPILDCEAPLLHRLIPKRALADLRPLFRTVVHRTLFEAIERSARVEIAFDQGEIRASRRKLPICEIELELKRGTSASLFKLAREIGATIPVRLGIQSKSARGYALSQPSKLQAVKAGPIHLAADMTSAKAFQTIAQSCTHHFRQNETVLSTRDDADALHQTRVALRRLRSALTLFKPMLADKHHQALREEIKWMATTLGIARNIDVLIASVEGRSVPNALLTARQKAYAQARAALDTPRWRKLMLDLAEWLTAGRWLIQAENTALYNEPISSRAVRILDRSRKRLKRRGRGLADLDDHARHRARVEAKKLRYAAEFFETLFPGAAKKRHRKAFGKAIQALLEDLGELNDLATVSILPRELGLPGPVPTRTRNRKRLLTRAERKYDELFDVTPFWH